MWSMDGEAMSENPAPIPFRLVEKVRVNLINDTMMPHPIHIHAHFFELVSGEPGSRAQAHRQCAAGGKASFDLTAGAEGDVLARSKAGYTQRITQSLVLEPEAEVDFAFQDVPALNVGAGFERLEMGTRLRYERNRSLAPYVGVNWERKLGGTARIARAAGEGVSGVSAVFGVRAMF